MGHLNFTSFKFFHILKNEHIFILEVYLFIFP
jgi:hypothetical protein